MADVYLEPVAADGAGGDRKGGEQWSIRTALGAFLSPPPADPQDVAAALYDAHEEDVRAAQYDHMMRPRPARRMAEGRSPASTVSPSADPPVVPVESPLHVDPYKHITLSCGALYGRPASDGVPHVGQDPPLAGRLPPLNWDRDSPLNLQSGFHDAVARINKYVDVWNRGTHAEEAFDALAESPSVITEDLVVSTDMIRETRIGELGSDMGGTSLAKWKRVMRRRTERGDALYKWFEMLIETYHMMPTLKLIDYTELLREYEAEEAERTGVDAISRMHARRIARTAHPSRAPTKVESQKIALDMIQKLEKGPIPYARVVVHHTLCAALQRYRLRASVRMSMSNAHERAFVADDAPSDVSWAAIAWQTFSGEKTTVEQYAYYQSPDEMMRTPGQNVLPRPLAPTRWCNTVTFCASILSRRRYYETPCIFMHDHASDRYRMLRIPEGVTKATICAQVIMSLTVPVWSREGRRSVLEASYVPLPVDHDQVRHPATNGKQTPFNCDDPTCTGVRSCVRRCIVVPLDATKWVDEKKRVRVSVHTSVAHSLVIPFIWGLSRVHANVQIQAHDSPHRNQDRHNDPASGLLSAMHDRATYAYFTNVRFVCDMDVLRIALSELFEYKRIHAADGPTAERYRSAAEFVRRGK